MCGIFGLTCSDYNYTIAGYLYSGLMALQHRGQIFTGISTSPCNDNIYTLHKRGIVSKVLTPNTLKRFPGNSGIGHVSCGPKNVFKEKDAQPFHLNSKIINFSISMNGTFTNREKLIKKLENLGKIFVGNSDVELLATLIETIYQMKNDLTSVIKTVKDIVKGAYSIIILTKKGHLYGFKDNHSYKPLCYGSVKRDQKRFYAISSESCALDALGINLCNEINSFDIIHINPSQKLEIIPYKKHEKKKFCIFEYIYFSRPDSIIDEISVFDVRYLLGVNLVHQENQNFSKENTIVVPVPDSGRSAAMGYAWESGLQYQEGLIKNRYIWQLKSNPEDKLNSIKRVVRKKNVILIDDSILSGKTMKKIIHMLREAGAKSVHVRISSPPVNEYCQTNERYLEREHLIAENEFNSTTTSEFNKRICDFINADSLNYQSISGLLSSISKMKKKVCLKCFTKNEDRKENELIKLNSFN